MEGNVQKQIEDRLAELPDDVQEAIASANFDEQIQDIATKHQLHIDQASTLGDEILLVMLGFSNPAAFATTLADKLNITPQIAEAITEEATNQLFMPIRQSMQTFLEKKAQIPPASTAGSTTLPPPPQLPELHAAEGMLQTPTITIPPTPAQKPNGYKADPYREPVE